jgi:hypothetical protein
MQKEALKLGLIYLKHFSELTTLKTKKRMETIYINQAGKHEGIKRLPTYARAVKTPAMRLTERDRGILEAIQAFDGMLADYQIQKLFFQGKRQMQYRMSLLFHHAYVARPDRKRRAAIPSMIYWLNKKGARYVAGLSGQTLKEFKFREDPKWFTIKHDIAINDFRLAVMEACALNREFKLEQWIPDGEFWANPDKVEYKLPNGKKKSALVRPDGFFSIVSRGYRYKFLLEIDMATEDNPRFVRQKVLPGLAYLKSKAYRERFGGENSGRWLVVTTGERRLQNMLAQTRAAAGEEAALFYFTTFGELGANNLFQESIWKRGDMEATQKLIVLIS